MNDVSFISTIGEMKSFMNENDVTLYAAIIVMGADGHDLDTLLTSIYLSGKAEGINIATKTIKEKLNVKPNLD